MIVRILSFCYVAVKPKYASIIASIFSQLLGVSLHEWKSLAAIIVRITSWVVRRSKQDIHKILIHDFTTKLLDASGQTAFSRKRQQGQFLEGNYIIFEGFAWSNVGVLAIVISMSLLYHIPFENFPSH